MTPKFDIQSIERIFARALASETFERLGPRRGTWDVSADCDNPKPVVMFSRATGLFKDLRKDGLKSRPMIELTLLTPCRRCRVCLAKKARLWRVRAMEEINAADRTWFVTLTCRPEIHFWMDSVCSTRKGDFEQLAPAQQFAERAQVLGIEVTKYLKRLRRATGCQFRYLMVTEIHKQALDGRPHAHLLIHETPGQPLRKQKIESQWHHGYTTVKLVDNANRGAWYVSKYISKAQDARVRASLGYGEAIHSDSLFE